MKSDDRELSVEELDTVTGRGAIDTALGLAGAAWDRIKDALSNTPKATLSKDNESFDKGMIE